MELFSIRAQMIPLCLFCDPSRQTIHNVKFMGPLTVTFECQGQHMLAPCECIYYGGCSNIEGLSKVLASEHVVAILRTHGPSASLTIPG